MSSLAAFSAKTIRLLISEPPLAMGGRRLIHKGFPKNVKIARTDCLAFLGTKK